jgi:hypothetical protein
MVDRRVWWGAGILIAGIGAGALVGPAIASADDGADGGKPATSQSSTTHGPERPSSKHASMPRAASPSGPDVSAVNQSAVRTVKADYAEIDRHDSATGRRTPLKTVVLRVTAGINDAVDNTVAGNPVRHLVRPTASPSDTTLTDSTSTPLRKPAATSTVTSKAALLPAPSDPVVPVATPQTRPVDLNSAKAATLSVQTPSVQAPTAAQTLAAVTTTPIDPIVIQAAPTLGPIASAVLNILSSFGWKPQPFVVSLFPALKPWAGVPVPTPIPAIQDTSGATPPTTAGTVLVGHSTLSIPCGPGYTARADWYFPTQPDGTVNAQGIIWLQHGFLANSSFYSALATNLAANTNSIVVVPTITSNPLACAGCWLNGDSMQKAAASLFVADRTALNQSAAAAGFTGTLPGTFVLAGHSAGGNFAATVANYTIANGAAVGPEGENLLRGVLMFDGVTSDSVLGTVVPKLNALGIPIYQIAGRNQIWNAFGQGTDALLKANPGRFDGVVLVGGSHVDSMLGSNPVIDFFAQLITKFSPPGNTNAVYVFADGWINDMYAGNAPIGPLYPAANVEVKIGNATAVGLPAPWAQLAPIQKLFNAISSFFGNLFGTLTGAPGAAQIPAAVAA